MRPAGRDSASDDWLPVLRLSLSLMLWAELSEMLWRLRGDSCGVMRGLRSSKHKQYHGNCWAIQYSSHTNYTATEKMDYQGCWWHQSSLSLMFPVFSTISRYFYSGGHGMGYYRNWNNKLRNAGEARSIIFCMMSVFSSANNREYLLLSTVQCPEYCPHQNMKIFQYWFIKIFYLIAGRSIEKKTNRGGLFSDSSILISDSSFLNAWQHPGLGWC